MDKKFQFHIPVELVKSDDDENEWKVAGIASTEDQDLQGESVIQDGIDISLLKAGRGLFNFDHQKGPENVLGQIEDAEFVTHEGRKALLVKGYLFKHQDRAKAFYNILKSLKKGTGPRVHMSIEGKILERDFRNPKAIKKARVEKVALTLDPVNPYTYAELVKSLNAEDNSQESEPKVERIELDMSDVQVLVELAEKSLMAGAPQGAPVGFSAGEATSKESLESRVKKVTYGKKEKKNRKEMIKSVIESVRKAYPDHDPLTLTEWVLEAFLAKSDEGDSRG